MFWKRKTARTGFPKNFRGQRIGVRAASAMVDWPPSEIVAAFQHDPQPAQALLTEAQDKQYSPSTFLKARNGGFQVGWYSREGGDECIQEFDDLADAAADYLLFSLGKGRWSGAGKSYPAAL